jgi:hypothetical protein
MTLVHVMKKDGWDGLRGRDCAMHTCNATSVATIGTMVAVGLSRISSPTAHTTGSNGSRGSAHMELLASWLANHGG